MALEYPAMDNSQNIYAVVMQHLREKRVSQRRIAAGSGVPFSTVTKIAQGQIKAPNVHHVQALYDYFKKVGAAYSAPASGFMIEKIKSQQRNFGELPDGSPDPSKRGSEQIGKTGATNAPAAISEQEAA